MFGYRDGGRLDSGSQRFVNLKGTASAAFRARVVVRRLMQSSRRDQIFGAPTVPHDACRREGIREEWPLARDNPRRTPLNLETAWAGLTLCGTNASAIRACSARHGGAAGVVVKGPFAMAGDLDACPLRCSSENCSCEGAIGRQ